MPSPRISAAIAVAVLAATASSAHAQDADPAVGSWVLNVAKSTFSPGPAPKQMTRTYSMDGAKMHMVLEGVDGAGKPQKTEITAAYDGKDYPVIGSPNWDMITIKRVNASTVDAVLKKDGKMVGKSHRVVAKDGKSFTITTSARSADGKKMEVMEVYDRK